MDIQMLNIESFSKSFSHALREELVNIEVFNRHPCGAGESGFEKNNTCGSLAYGGKSHADNLRNTRDRASKLSGDEIRTEISKLSSLPLKELKEVEKDFLGVNLGKNKEGIINAISEKIWRARASQEHINTIKSYGSEYDTPKKKEEPAKPLEPKNERTVEEKKPETKEKVQEKNAPEKKGDDSKGKIEGSEPLSRLKSVREQAIDLDFSDINKEISNLSNLSVSELKEIEKGFLGVNVGKGKKGIIDAIEDRILRTRTIQERSRDIEKYYKVIEYFRRHPCGAAEDGFELKNTCQTLRKGFKSSSGGTAIAKRVDPNRSTKLSKSSQRIVDKIDNKIDKISGKTKPSPGKSVAGQKSGGDTPDQGKGNPQKPLTVKSKQPAPSKEKPLASHSPEVVNKRGYEELDKVKKSVQEAEDALSKADDDFRNYKNLPGDPIFNYSDTHNARQKARDRYAEVLRERDTWRNWEEGVKKNPNLIPPFDPAERVKIYAERKGKQQVESIVKATEESYNNSSKIESLISQRKAVNEKFNTLDQNADPKEVNDLLRENERLRKEILSIRNDSTPKIRADVINAIKSDNPIKYNLNYNDYQNQKNDPATMWVKETAEKGMDFLKQIVSVLGSGDLDVPVASKSFSDPVRGAYCNSKGIVLEDSNSPAVMVHEFGHWLDKNSGSGDAAYRFMRYRVGDEKVVDLQQKFPASGFSKDEWGRKDKFDSIFDGHSAYYVGKEYSHSRKDSELTSMGLQALYENGAKFARKDPEYCMFILGILNGDLR